MEEGHTMTAICTYSPHLPNVAIVSAWSEADLAVRDRLRRARETMVDVLADQTVLIADTDIDAVRAGQRIKARQWLAGVVKPKVYGPKATIDVNHTVDPEAMRAAALERARSMRDQLGQWSSQVIDGQTESDDTPTD